jgi:hypothetical protein
MKVTMTLKLKTREVNQLFERKMNGDRLFINAILHKFNRVTGECRKQAPDAQETYQLIEKSMLSLAQEFSDETSRFRGMLEKETGLSGNKITITPSFHSKINIENSLAMRLIELLETYDNLIAMLKLLHLAGCFASQQDYYANITRVQKKLNRALSRIIV